MFFRKQELFFFKPHLHSQSFQGKIFLPANIFYVLRVRLWNMRAPDQLFRFHVHSVHEAKLKRGAVWDLVWA